jgi:predicted NBD/HSP70 family sugar kinase
MDLGGTKLSGVLGDAAGATLAILEQPTQAHRPGGVIAQIGEFVRELVHRSGVERSAIEHVALGVPGAIDGTGRVGLSPNVNFDPALPLGPALEASLGWPVAVENDGNLAAFGEMAVGRGRERGARSLVFLALGTGVGMGLILDGSIVRGHSGAAGEIGYLPFGRDPYTAAQQAPGGSFEAVSGSEAIRKGFAARSGSYRTVREIFDLAEGGDTTARIVIDQALDDIAVGVAATVAIVDPGLVVIGGGIGSRPGVAEAIGARTVRLIATPCEVIASALGDRAGAVGAFAYARSMAIRGLLRGGIDPLPAAATP